MDKIINRGGVIMLIALCLGCEDLYDRIEYLESEVVRLQASQDNSNSEFKSELNALKKQIRSLSTRERSLSEIDQLKADIEKLQSDYAELIESDTHLQEQINDLKLSLVEGPSELINDGWYVSEDIITYDFIEIETGTSFYSYFEKDRNLSSWQHPENYWNIKNNRVIDRGRVNRIGPPYFLTITDSEGYVQPESPSPVHIVNIESFDKSFNIDDLNTWMQKIEDPREPFNNPKFDINFKQSFTNLFENITDEYEHISLSDSYVNRIDLKKRGLFDILLVISYIKTSNFCIGEWTTIQTSPNGYNTSFEETDCQKIKFQLDVTYNIDPLITFPFQTNLDYKSDRGFFGDPVYSKIERGNAKSYLLAFIEDAKRHGVDLSHVNVDDFIFKSKDIQNWAGLAYAVCDDSKVHIEIDNTYWDIDKRISSEYDWTVLDIMWHEFGHDILNLNHTCTSHSLLNNIWDENLKCDNYINSNSFYFDHPDPNWNWQRAVKDMFEGVGQNPYNCAGSRGGRKIACHSHEY